MSFDIAALLKAHEGENYALHEAHINPVFARMLKTIGFDRCYVRAEGPYLWDVKGEKYLDFLSGYGVFALGRNHPLVRDALTDFMNLGYSSLVKMEAPLPAGLLAAELKKRVCVEMDTVFFCNSGAEGVETAVKYARAATGRSVIVHCGKAFHGLTLAALALNGDESFRDGFGPLDPHTRLVPFDDLGALEAALHQGDVAAFVVEPIQGKGVNLPRPGYLSEAARLCHKHGALFVADEVQTGLGRTGRFLCIEHEPAPVEADIVVLSKALSGGFVPVGAVLTKRWISERVFDSMERAVVHSTTFGQNALAMVAGLATLAAYDELQVIENAARRGREIMDGLEAMKARYPFIKEVRGRGVMIGIEFRRPDSLGLGTAWDLIHKMNQSLFPQAVVIPLLDDHRVLTQVAGHHIDVVKLLPPLIIGEADVSWFLESFEAVMKGMHRFPGPVWKVLAKLGKAAMTSRPSTEVA
ncbi:MAG: aspartate aminotransferase family protein [Alphaproteobacteria bacterium]